MDTTFLREAEEGKGQSQNQAKSKKGLTAFLALCAIGLAGTAYALMSDSSAFTNPEPQVPKIVGENPETTFTGTPIFATLEPFVVNLASPNEKTFFQLHLIYSVKDEASSQAMQSMTPIIRSRILMELAGKTRADLEGEENRKKLMQEVLEIARVATPGNTPDETKGIIDVHFSSFVIQ